MRWAVEQDYDQLLQLMANAIEADPSPYTLEQRRAWRSRLLTGSSWNDRLRDQAVLLAEDADGPLGFMSLKPDGYIDLAYIRSKGRGRGLFRALYTQIENRAREDGLTLLSTHASLAAEGPFRSMGFSIGDWETVTINGENLRRAAMEKRL